MVVESNYGGVELGIDLDAVYTKEVVIKRNHGLMHLNNSMDRVEIQESTYSISIWG